MQTELVLSILKTGIVEHLVCAFGKSDVRSVYHFHCVMFKHDIS